MLRPGVAYRYGANALYTYLLANKDVVEPLQRHALNELELRRLDRAVDAPTARRHGFRRVAGLLGEATLHARSREMHRSELAFFFEDDIRGVLNGFFALICSTRVQISEAPSLLPEGTTAARPGTTLTLSFGGEVVNETISRLGSSQGPPLPLPEVPAFDSLELRAMLRNNLRHRWEMERVIEQLQDMLRHLYRCAPSRAIEVFHGYITPSAAEISDRMAAFDAQLAMEFGLEVADLRYTLFDAVVASATAAVEAMTTTPGPAPASPAPAVLL